MRIVVSDFISLDGVAQAPGQADEDRDGGFAHGGWSMPHFDPATMGPAVAEALAQSECLLFGRRTYAVMAAAWPGRAGDPFADRMNSMEKYVVSGSLSQEDLNWPNSHLVRPSDVAGTVASLRGRPGGDVQVMGSLSVARTLIAEGLADELRLMIEPVLLGGGKSLFPTDGVARALELVSADQASTGVLICVYRPRAV